MAKKEYYLYVKGKAVPVSEEVCKSYWKITKLTLPPLISRWKKCLKNAIIQSNQFND